MGSFSLLSRELYDILKGNQTYVERFISEMASFIESLQEGGQNGLKEIREVPLKFHETKNRFL